MSPEEALKIKLLMADKRELFREGLAEVLKSEPQIEVVSKCATGLEAIQQASETKPDIILLDTEISDCGCIEVIQRICELVPKTRIIILTHSETESGLYETFKAGAKAFLSKDIGVGDLFRAIALVNSGEAVISPPMATRLLADFNIFAESKARSQKQDTVLSKREEEVLALVAKGATNREIASTLFITENTVKVHLSKIMEKLGVHNRLQAAALARGDSMVPREAGQ